MPCSPTITNGDADANPRAHIREHSNIHERNWSGDGVAEVRLMEDSGPPVEVIDKTFWGSLFSQYIPYLT